MKIAEDQSGEVRKYRQCVQSSNVKRWCRGLRNLSAEMGRGCRQLVPSAAGEGGSYDHGYLGGRGG